MSGLRVVLAEDDVLLRGGLAGILERSGFEIVGQAGDSTQLLTLVHEQAPALVVVDIDLGGESGLELARRLYGEADLAGSPVILISTHAERDYAELIAASRAIGFLPKTDLSADAIQDLLHSYGDSNPGDPISGPRGT